MRRLIANHNNFSVALPNFVVSSAGLAYRLAFYYDHFFTPADAHAIDNVQAPLSLC
ncbi:MAG: hypothetical protein ABSB19_20415 [Methylomonas sp.]